MKLNKKREQLHRKRTDPYYQTKEWKLKRDMVWIRDEALCQQCKREGRLMPLRRGFNEGHVDHIDNRKLGGGDDLNNLELLCKPCHDKKSAKERKY